MNTYYVQVIVERDFSADYVYYKIPIPWLQVKLLRLLQYFPPTGNILSGSYSQSEFKKHAPMVQY